MKMLFIVFFLSLLSVNAEEKSIVVIIPSYNNLKWYEINLDSILWQDYENFHVIYIDDASTDGTGYFLSQYLSQNDRKNRVTLIRNQQRIGALANIYSAVAMCQPTDIIVTIDGDDWLYHESVFKILNHYYSDPNVWMTYGQFIAYPSGRKGDAEQIPEEVIENNRYREYKWVTTHLRTFYAGLFQKINKEDLLYRGNFYPVTWDMAFMFPMMEMASHHSRFCPEELYIYNEATPFSDNKIRKELQRYLDKWIRGRKRYAPITQLFP